MKKLVVIPGGFHPFHPGHQSLYDDARKYFPDADVYVAATADTSTRPFPFEIKRQLALLSGIPKDRFVQVKSPFNSQNLAVTLGIDPEQHQLIYVRSDKDKLKPPQAGGVKRDGSPSYLQPWHEGDLEPMTQQGYMAYLPTQEFDSGSDKKYDSASHIRQDWPTLDQAGKLTLVMNLYPKTRKNKRLAEKTVEIFDRILAPIDENQGWAATLERRDNKKHDADIVKKAEVDPELRNALVYAKQHYQQHREDPIMSFMKWVQRSLMHSEKEDINQDRQIAQLQSRVRELVNQLQHKEPVDETTLINNPERGIQIQPDGGIGTWNEESLIKNLAGKFSSAAQMLRNREYGSLYYNLYGNGATRSLVKALADLEQFQQKQGNRPMAPGREIQVGEEMAGTPAVGGMRASYQSRENQPIQDYVDEGHT